MIDIGELKRLYQAATNPPDSEDVFVFGAPSMEAASAIVSAAPALLAELEAARKVCEAADELRLSVAHDLRCSESDNADEIHDSTEQLAAALDKLGKAFAEWQKARGE